MAQVIIEQSLMSFSQVNNQALDCSFNEECRQAAWLLSYGEEIKPSHISVAAEILLADYVPKPTLLYYGYAVGDDNIYPIL